MTSFEFHALPGLPAYAEPALVFSATGSGVQSEGLVVHFAPTEAWPWVGNFVPGRLSKFQLLTPHPNGHDAIIICGGQGYVVDPFSKRLVQTFGGGIVSAFTLSTRNAIVLNHQNVEFEAIGAKGRIWITRRISWDV